MDKSLADRISDLRSRSQRVRDVAEWDGILADVRELERNDARYRKVKEYVTVWESRMQETLGKLTLSIEFNADGDDIDAALDAISKTKGST